MTSASAASAADCGEESARAPRQQRDTTYNGPGAREAGKSRPCPSRHGKLKCSVLRMAPFAPVFGTGPIPGKCAHDGSVVGRVPYHRHAAMCTSKHGSVWVSTALRGTLQKLLPTTVFPVSSGKLGRPRRGRRVHGLCFEVPPGATSVGRAPPSGHQLWIEFRRLQPKLIDDGPKSERVAQHGPKSGQVWPIR